MERISRFTDMEIVGSDGNLLGWVKGFSFAAVGDWRVTSVALKLEKESHEELGVKKPMMGGAIVDMGVDNIRTVSDNIILKVPQRTMKPNLKVHAPVKDITNVIERKVIDKDGKDLGVVTDVLMDTSTWRFSSVLVKLDKEILDMLKKGKCPDCGRNVTIQLFNVSSIGDNVMLSITKEQLGDLVQKAPVKTM
jgi:sporulation protein YlmC with PRC-barrel domain